MPMHIVQKNPHDFIPQGSGNNQSDSSQSFVTWNIENGIKITGQVFFFPPIYSSGFFFSAML
jgi:hypothetical protein